MNTYLVWEQGETKADALTIESDESDDEYDAACEWCRQNEAEYTESDDIKKRHLVVSSDGVEKKVVVYPQMSIDYSAYDERAE